MRKYITFVVSFSILFISWLPVGKSAQARYIETIATTQNSSPMILKHADQIFLQNDEATQIAGHYSHRSHSSHRSHHSHYSSRR
jgi:hypothetical protein